MSEFDFRERLNGPPRQVVICNSAMDDLRELVEDVSEDPLSHGLCAVVGFASGCAVTVGLAWVWSWFL